MARKRDIEMFAKNGKIVSDLIGWKNLSEVERKNECPFSGVFSYCDNVCKTLFPRVFSHKEYKTICRECPCGHSAYGEEKVMEVVDAIIEVSKKEKWDAD